MSKRFSMPLYICIPTNHAFNTTDNPLWLMIQGSTNSDFLNQHAAILTSTVPSNIQTQYDSARERYADNIIAILGRQTKQHTAYKPTQAIHINTELEQTTQGFKLVAMGMKYAAESVVQTKFKPGYYQCIDSHWFLAYKVKTKHEHYTWKSMDIASIPPGVIVRAGLPKQCPAINAFYYDGTEHILACHVTTISDCCRGMIAPQNKIKRLGYWEAAINGSFKFIAAPGSTKPSRNRLSAKVAPAKKHPANSQIKAPGSGN
jgi:hypothetical protein